MTDPAAFRRRLPDDARIATWHAADGWALRRFDWPAPNQSRGSILFQGGRGDVFEKYLEAFAHWHDRGWSITSFDWRGQGGSGRLSPDPHVGHADSFAPFIADARAFYGEWAQAAKGPRVLMGHSMGGHLVLRALVEGAATPDAAVLIAPMLGLHSPLGARGGGWLARLMTALGDPARAAWKANEIPVARDPRQALLTHDRERYADELWWQREKLELQLGPPSWQWVAQAFASTAALHADPRLRSLAIPVLMLVADADKLVDARAARRIAALMPEGELLRFGSESAHEILREADPVRDRALAAIDSFLAERAPAR